MSRTLASTVASPPPQQPPLPAVTTVTAIPHYLDRPVGRMTSGIRNTTSSIASSIVVSGGEVISGVSAGGSGTGDGGDGSSEGALVSASIFGFLYSEIVQYHQNRVDSISDLERRLEATGYGVGLRVLELLAYRSRDFKREIRLMGILQFVSTTVWKSLFGKPADSLERSLDHPDEYMIIDYSPLTSRYTVVPPDFGPSLSVDAYLSGIIAGVLQGADFPARVTAHTVTLEEGESAPYDGTPAILRGASSSGGLDGAGHEWLPPRLDKAVFLVKFAPAVVARDESLG